MADIEKVIAGLKKVWDAFNGMEHELYADYVFDALELLQAQKWTSVKERYPDNSVDAFIKWCSESHMMGDATLEGIKYWVGKYKEQL